MVHIRLETPPSFPLINGKPRCQGFLWRGTHGKGRGLSGFILWITTVNSQGHVSPALDSICEDGRLYFWGSFRRISGPQKVHVHIFFADSLHMLAYNIHRRLPKNLQLWVNNMLYVHCYEEIPVDLHDPLLQCLEFRAQNIQQMCKAFAQNAKHRQNICNKYANICFASFLHIIWRMFCIFVHLIYAKLCNSMQNNMQSKNMQKVQNIFCS